MKSVLTFRERFFEHVFKVHMHVLRNTMIHRSNIHFSYMFFMHCVFIHIKIMLLKCQKHDFNIHCIWLLSFTKHFWAVCILRV